MITVSLIIQQLPSFCSVTLINAMITFDHVKNIRPDGPRGNYKERWPDQTATLTALQSTTSLQRVLWGPEPTHQSQHLPMMQHVTVGSRHTRHESILLTLCRSPGRLYVAKAMTTTPSAASFGSSLEHRLHVNKQCVKTQRHSFGIWTEAEFETLFMATCLWAHALFVQ